MDLRYKMRGQTRYKVNLPVQVRELGSFDWSAGSLVNLSKTGLCLASREAYSLEQELEIEVPTVDREGKAQQRRMTGKVVWRKGYRYGVFFTGGDKRKVAGKSPGKSRSSSHLKRV